jgi:rare lipoprotein A
MIITCTHRKGAVSVFALVLAALLPGLMQGEAATAQVIPGAALTVPETRFAPVPAEIVDPMIGEEDATDPPAVVDEGVILDEGWASYYGAELAGNRTASGERFNPAALTAAHRTLPMGTMLKVTNIANGKSVIVRINDRGPFVKSRIIDISRGAAEKIAMIRSGTARVTLEQVS